MPGLYYRTIAQLLNSYRARPETLLGHPRLMVCTYARDRKLHRAACSLLAPSENRQCRTHALRRANMGLLA
eukprot:14190215-Alexandrium_andersonii.AAC.1